jgi:hypothetical protein
VYIPDVILQCIRKVFGYFSNNIFPAAVKYLLNGPSGNLGNVWKKFNYKEGKDVKSIFKMVLVGNTTSVIQDFNDL